MALEWNGSFLLVTQFFPIKMDIGRDWTPILFPTPTIINDFRLPYLG